MSRLNFDNLTQCLLKFENWTTVLWIPTKSAEIGKKFRYCGGLWTVFEVYSIIELSKVKDLQHNAKDIWKATSGKDPRGNK